MPLLSDIDQYFENEIKPFLDNAWIDRSKDKVGYEINFTKYFYKFNTFRKVEEILSEISSLDKDINLFSREI